MLPAPFIVLLDANVLFPFSLRDILLRAAAAGFYQVRWSSQILDEMTRNLVSAGTMPGDKAIRLRAIMTREFPEAEVTGYEHLIAAMKNHMKDRHVVAAAVKAGATSCCQSGSYSHPPPPLRSALENILVMPRKG